jgi:DNA-binding transcriptional regulator YdaS (Cro superfamily)
MAKPTGAAVGGHAAAAVTAAAAANGGSMLCQQLVGPLSPERKAIGLDIEWEYLAALIQSGDSDTTQAPTAIGFATNQCVVIGPARWRAARCI